MAFTARLSVTRPARRAWNIKKSLAATVPAAVHNVKEAMAAGVSFPLIKSKRESTASQKIARPLVTTKAPTTRAAIVSY